MVLAAILLRKLSVPGPCRLRTSRTPPNKHNPRRQVILYKGTSGVDFRKLHQTHSLQALGAGQGQARRQRRGTLRNGDCVAKACQRFPRTLLSPGAAQGAAHLLKNGDGAVGVRAEAQVRHADAALAAGERKRVARRGVELGRRDHLPPVPAPSDTHAAGTRPSA